MNQAVYHRYDIADVGKKGVPLGKRTVGGDDD